MNKELKSILDKLEKLTYIAEGNNNYSLETKEGFTVGLNLELQNSKNPLKLPPIQAKLYVHYKGSSVAHWGCVDEVDTKAIVDFYLAKKQIAFTCEIEAKDKEKSIGKAIFSVL